MRQSATKALVHKGLSEQGAKEKLDEALKKLGSIVLGTAFTNLSPQASSDEVWEVLKQVASNPDKSPSLTWIIRAEGRHDARTANDGYTLKERGKSKTRKGGKGKSGKGNGDRHGHTNRNALGKNAEQQVPEGTTLIIRSM